MDTRQGRAGFSRGLVAFQSRSGGLGIVGQLPPVRGGRLQGCPARGVRPQPAPVRLSCSNGPPIG